MVTMPEDGPILILPPGECEVQLSAAEIKLQLQILLNEAFTLRRAGLQSQAAILVVRSGGQDDSMAERFAAEISGSSHQPAQVCISSINPRHRRPGAQGESDQAGNPD
jgi:hypothetical protein